VEHFAQLLSCRWIEAQHAVGIPGHVRLSWEITPDYPHFKKKRGYGVTFYDGKPACHMAYAPKILSADITRADAIVRHEIGHVIDMCTDKGALNRWARSRGVRLAKTAERRADAIAHAIWGEPLRYDRDLVQNTTTGVYPRPYHLGL
jgi:hypothetical protein